ncbi:MAG: DNA-processing protein DprA [Clostridiales bacterium]|jgi:DNA processing protein|nr:DNA-processing protein DprA [Clostridiales bacterium]
MKKLDEQLIYDVWLSSVARANACERCNALRVFGSAKKVFEATPQELAASEIAPKMVDLLSDKDLDLAKKIFAECEEKEIGLLQYEDCDYPPLLRDLPDAPTLLYYVGNLRQLIYPIAMVGARNFSHYGERYAEKIAYRLAENGCVIVSGMARGIDSIAHKGAIMASGRTIAVLGCGVDVLYPPENGKLKQMIEKSGAVVSEHPPGTKPLSMLFPARNRLICGMSLGTVVVECTKSSGSRITADLAWKQGRVVYTLPTNLDNERGSGNIEMLQKGARMMTCAEDLLRDIGIDAKESSGDLEVHKAVKGRELSPDQKKIVAALDKNEPKNTDDLVNLTGLSAQEINALLTILEIWGKIRKVSGKNYIKTS